MQPSNVVLVGRSVVNVVLFPTFLAVQYLQRNDEGFAGLFTLYCFSPITPFPLLWYKAIRICSGIIWESERRLKAWKPPFSLGSPMWYLFHKVFFAEFNFHLGKIMGTEWMKQL